MGAALAFSKQFAEIYQRLGQLVINPGDAAAAADVDRGFEGADKAGFTRFERQALPGFFQRRFAADAEHDSRAPLCQRLRRGGQIVQ